MIVKTIVQVDKRMNACNAIQSYRHKPPCSGTPFPCPLPQNSCLIKPIEPPLLYSDRLGQVPGEIDIETFTNGKPIRDELQRNNIEEALQTVHCLRNLDFLCLLGRKFGVVRIADDNWTTATRDDCKLLVTLGDRVRQWKPTLLVRIQGLRKNLITSENHDDRQIFVHQSQDTMLQLTRHNCFAMQI